jgi:uncharacterized membrane protein YfcA
MNPSHVLGLAMLGVAVGAIGTLIGAGGGFLLVPILALVDAHESAAVLTGISLMVVSANATSGSFAYARMRRIDYRSGLIFALAGLPGALLGAWLTRALDRRVFDPLLGAVLILGAGAILLHPHGRDEVPAPSGTRRLIERGGTIHVYTPRVALGALISVAVGFISSLLGIGGGIIHVPVMALLLGFPTHVATATSHFVLAILTLAGVLVHLADGTLGAGLGRAIPLSGGVIVGAQLGAWLSSRVQGRWILRGLAVALASVGLRLVLSPVWSM